MDQQGIRDFQMAKSKAVHRLGVGKRFPLPSNREIEEVLRQRLRLFSAGKLQERCRSLLDLAMSTMQTFSSFEPRLVGALVRGVVTEKTPVELHMFTDVTEDLAHSIEAQGIPYEQFDKRVRFRKKRFAFIPAFRFASGDIGIEILAFGRKDIREAPLCPVEGQPMQRIALSRAKECLVSV